MIVSQDKNYAPSDIVLVMCPAWGVLQPPVSISYLKSFLSRQGITVRCIDLSLDLYNQFPEKKFWDLNYPEYFILPPLFNNKVLPTVTPLLDRWAQKILSARPKVIGFSLYMSNLNTSLLLATHLRVLDPGVLIVGGGAEVNRIKRVAVDGIKAIAPINQDIFNIFDALIIGEGEQSLWELVSLLKRGHDYHTCDGIIYTQGGEIVANKDRGLLGDLDMLAAPDFDDFVLDEYLTTALPLVTSRGCINRCTFCADSPLWKTYRVLSPQKVFDDIENLIKKYGVMNFEIVDSTFNGDLRRVEEICDYIITSGINITWSAKATIREGMSYGLLKKMREAGCCSLGYGIESASSQVLKDMKKNMDIDQAKRVIKDTHRAGIQANCFFIIGYPTETEEDFQQTLDFIEENAAYINSFGQVTGCHIEEDSYLGLNVARYGIAFKDDGWYSRVSTPQIRRERLERFKTLARKLHRHYKCEVQL